LLLSVGSLQKRSVFAISVTVKVLSQSPEPKSTGHNLVLEGVFIIWFRYGDCKPAGKDTAQIEYEWLGDLYSILIPRRLYRLLLEVAAGCLSNVTVRQGISHAWFCAPDRAAVFASAM